MAVGVQESVAAEALRPREGRAARLLKRVITPATRPDSRKAALIVRLRANLAAAFAVEVARGSGLVVFASLFAIGAVIYFSLPREPSVVMLGASLAVAAGAAVATPHRRRIRAASLALVALLLGVLAGSLETWRSGTQMSGGAITTRLTARVVGVEERADGRVRLTLDVISTERPQLRFAPERMRATARSVPETMLPGHTVTGVVRLLPATGPARPGGFDFSFESYFAGIGASGFFLTGPVAVELPASASVMQKLATEVEAFRERLADHIRARIAGPEGEIAAALIAGVRGGITEEDNEALRRTGLAHFISISGLHMALVAAIVLFTLRSGFALFPGFAMRHPVKKYAAGVALLSIAAYLVISGQQVAAQRSFLMFAVMLVAVLVDRAALTMRNLAISALAILAIWPHEIMGPSFQMSFAATGALIAAYAWYAERRRDRGQVGQKSHATAVGLAGRAALTFFGGLAATSIIAGTATTIYGVWHFQRISPLGLVANLAAMPLVSVVVMPAALAGSLLIPVGLDGPLFATMGWGLATVMDISRWLSERSPIDAVGAIPATSVLMLSLALGLATVATTAVVRAASLPFLAIGVILIVTRHLPDALISEDGRLVAMRTEDNRLAVNRSRPSAFTISNWTHTLAGKGIVRPETGRGPAEASGIVEHGFVCAAGLCVARHSSGATIAHAMTEEAARGVCDRRGVLVIADPTVDDPCNSDEMLVVTSRALARRGSAAIHLSRTGARVEFAIAEEPRIWHRQRRFSREARGMPPYRREAPAEQGPAEDRQ